MNGLPYNSQPASTTITGIAGWGFAQGIGQLYSNYGDNIARAFLRGGDWHCGNIAGVLYLALYNSASTPGTDIGFRASR